MKRALPLDRMFFLAGPTGCGKTAVAIELARHCNGEIVNADAFQVYRGMEILTAAPTEQERADIPHHFFSHLSTQPIEFFTAYLNPSIKNMNYWIQ